MKRLLTIATCLLLSGCAGYRTVQMHAGADWAPPKFFEIDTGKFEVVVPVKDAPEPFAVRWHGFHAALFLPVTLEPTPAWGPPAVWGEAGEPTAPDSGDVVAWHGVHP